MNNLRGTRNVFFLSPLYKHCRNSMFKNFLWVSVDAFSRIFLHMMVVSCWLIGLIDILDRRLFDKFCNSIVLSKCKSFFDIQCSQMSFIHCCRRVLCERQHGWTCILKLSVLHWFWVKAVCWACLRFIWLHFGQYGTSEAGQMKLSIIFLFCTQSTFPCTDLILKYTGHDQQLIILPFDWISCNIVSVISCAVNFLEKSSTDTFVSFLYCCLDSMGD